MSETLLFSILGLLAIGAGYGIGFYIRGLKNKAHNSALEQQRTTLIKQLNELHIREDSWRKEQQEQTITITRQGSQIDQLKARNEEQQKDVERIQEKFTKEFENLANKILEEKSTKFTKQNKESLEHILNPLKEKIKTFEEKVERNQKERISINSALKEQLSTLQNQNLKITQEAENLTKALKGDSKFQGIWGELILERVLEKSHLEKDREYTVQKSFTLEDGSRVLPDVIIHLPDGKKMIVDSKVSLTDYEKYVNSEDQLRDKHLRDHVNSLNRHIAQLSSKKYEDLYEIESPDFVLMFIPVEPAYTTAANADEELYLRAFEKNIIIVTPTTLLATLRTIDTWWNNDKQHKNALEIAKQAGALYDKFDGLIGDLIKVGKRMNDAKGEYELAMNKLSTGKGNLISRVDRLKKLGAKAKKSMPESVLKKAQETDLNESQ
ncbi:MAG: DNA recombination protein RmuC [Eudoraea sp.]|nr:DNA recombination protein RmuC [Eudoraea sp.]